MMMNAYNELYLNDAIRCLANCFDYAINDCHISPDDFEKMFVHSGVSKNFEVGNPSIISGKSGEELVIKIIKKYYPNKEIPNTHYPFDRTPEYWAGWALAQYQWKTGKRFKDIFLRISLKEIILMYSVYHEMDISSFIETMEKKYYDKKLDTKLKTIREFRQISQSTLSKISNVSIRSIQLYEQEVNNIDKAQAHTLFKLARALGCQIEDLLESPERLYK